MLQTAAGVSSICCIFSYLIWHFDILYLVTQEVIIHICNPAMHINCIQQLSSNQDNTLHQCHQNGTYNYWIVNWCHAGEKCIAKIFTGKFRFSHVNGKIHACSLSCSKSKWNHCRALNPQWTETATRRLGFLNYFLGMTSIRMVTQHIWESNSFSRGSNIEVLRGMLSTTWLALHSCWIRGIELNHVHFTRVQEGTLVF